MKIVIIGGVAGGASAAARARRLSEDTQIIVLERGPDVSFANCGLPYYLGGEIAERSKLLVVSPDRLPVRPDRRAEGAARLESSGAERSGTSGASACRGSAVVRPSGAGRDPYYFPRVARRGRWRFFRVPT